MIIENKDQLIDIYDIWYEPFWQQGWFYTIVKTGICLLIVVAFYYLYKIYIQKKVTVDCALTAYHDLDTLKKFHIVTEQDSKDCYFRLSSIIKRYLTSRYQVAFTQLTDQEIVQQAACYMADDNVRMLQHLLQGMTFVKFEHEVAVYQKLENDIQLIKEFIQNTNPQHDTKEV